MSIEQLAIECGMHKNYKGELHRYSSDVFVGGEQELEAFAKAYQAQQGEAVAYIYDEYVDYEDCNAYWRQVVEFEKLSPNQIGANKEAIENNPTRAPTDRYLNERPLFTHPPSSQTRIEQLEAEKINLTMQGIQDKLEISDLQATNKKLLDALNEAEVKIKALPRFNFLLNAAGNGVDKWENKSGDWIERYEVKYILEQAIAEAEEK